MASESARCDLTGEATRDHIKEWPEESATVSDNNRKAYATPKSACAPLVTQSAAAQMKIRKRLTLSNYYLLGRDIFGIREEIVNRKNKKPIDLRALPLRQGPCSNKKVARRVATFCVTSFLLGRLFFLVAFTGGARERDPSKKWWLSYHKNKRAISRGCHPTASVASCWSWPARTPQQNYRERSQKVGRIPRCHRTPCRSERSSAGGARADC